MKLEFLKRHTSHLVNNYWYLNWISHVSDCGLKMKYLSFDTMTLNYLDQFFKQWISPETRLFTYFLTTVLSSTLIPLIINNIKYTEAVFTWYNTDRLRSDHTICCTLKLHYLLRFTSWRCWSHWYWQKFPTFRSTRRVGILRNTRRLK